MQYDIAAKQLLQRGKKKILEQIMGIPADKVRLLRELPNETVSLKAADFPLYVKEGQEKYVLVLELQTRWDADKLLSLMEYRIRFSRRFPGVNVKSCRLFRL